MEKIASKDIEKIVKKMNSISKGDAVSLTGLMRKEQPAVLNFLTGVGGPALNEEEREWVIFLGITIWQIFEQARAPFPEVKSEMLDNAAVQTAQLVSYLKDESEDGFRYTISKVLEGYHQPELLSYIVGALGVAQQEERKIRDYNMTIVFFFLKILIDCFDKACGE